MSAPQVARKLDRMLPLAQFAGLSTQALVVLAGAALTLLMLSIALRSRSAGKYEIKPADLLVAVVPVLLWLVATGKVDQVSFAGVELKTAAAFLEAADAPVNTFVVRRNQEAIGELVSMPSHESKGSTSKIPELAARRVPQLDLRLGRGPYDPLVLRKYFESSWGRTWFQWCVIHDGEQLFGVVPAKDLLAFLGTDTQRFERYAETVSSGGPKDRAWLRELPGWIDAEDAAVPETSKREALAMMEGHGSAQWPVVDDQGRYQGLVDRADVTASLLLSVAEALERARP